MVALFLNQVDRLHRILPGLIDQSEGAFVAWCLEDADGVLVELRVNSVGSCCAALLQMLAEVCM